MKQIEYSQIVRKKLQSLKGVAVSAMYDIECDYRYIYVGHNYIFYRVEKDAVIIVEMFDEREDFMHKLFGG